MERARTVVLLKSPARDGEEDLYVSAMQEADLCPSCVPVLGFSFVNLDELRVCLHQPGEYSGLILTSPRGVESVAQAVEPVTRRDDWSELWSEWCAKPAYVVGEATAGAAAQLGLATRGSDSGSAELLAPYIISDNVADSKPLLFPSGNLRREVIPKHMKKHNIALRSITTYETTPHPDIETTLVGRYPAAQPDIIVFYSPSGVNFTFPVLKNLNYDMEKLKCVAIGPTTREALENNLGGTAAAVSIKPTPGDLKSAITSMLSS